MEKYILISLGAIVGANLRYLIGGWAAERFGSSLPYGTLIINLSGSLLIGIFLTYTTERVLIDPRWRLLIAVGVLGGYTTFSSYTYESVNLILNGSWGAGLFNLFGSAFLGAVAVIVGIFIGRLL